MLRFKLFCFKFSSRNSAKVFSWLQVAELFMQFVEQTSKYYGWQHVTWKSPGCLPLQGQTPTWTSSPLNSPAFQAHRGYKAFAYKLQPLNEDTASDPLHRRTTSEVSFTQSARCPCRQLLEWLLAPPINSDISINSAIIGWKHTFVG